MSNSYFLSSLKRSLCFLVCMVLCNCAGGGSSDTTTSTESVTTEQQTMATIRAVAGLVEDTEQTHTTHVANTSSGTRYDVSTYGVDLSDSDHDDLPAIELVLSKAQAGDEIYFPDGTYNLKSTATSSSNYQIALVSGVNLTGESQDGTILKSALDDQGSGNLSVLFGYAVNNLVVSNMTITSEWNGSYSSDPTVTNPQSGGPTQAISIKGKKGVADAYNLDFINILVEKFRVVGIKLGNGVHDAVVDNCTARNATDLGGGGAGYGFTLQGAGHADPDENGANPYLGKPGYDNYFNEVRNSTAAGPYLRHGILLQYHAHNNLIDSNSLYDTAYGAIDLHGEDEYANEISYNQCHDIAMTSGKAGGCIELGNTGSTHDATGPDNWIHDNTSINSPYGVRVEYGTTYTLIENNVLRDNSRFSNGAAVRIGRADYIFVTNNDIIDNTVASFKAFYLVANDAVNDSRAGAAANCLISNNHLTDNNGDKLVIVSEETGNDYTQPE